MKKFDIITEADARVLERGSTVELARGGHITPLARDTLRERRITVIEEGRASADDLSLAPRRRHPVARDWQRPLGCRAEAHARHVPARARPGGSGVWARKDPIPSIILTWRPASRTASPVSEADAGIVIDASGHRVGDRREQDSRDPRCDGHFGNDRPVWRGSTHGANVLTLGATLVSADEAKAIVSAWLSTPDARSRTTSGASRRFAISSGAGKAPLVNMTAE